LPRIRRLATRPNPHCFTRVRCPRLDAPATRDAFERSLTCASDAAPRCLYADWLSRQGDAADRERAKSLYSEIVHDARHWPRHAREHNREWLQRAQVALGQ
jgi:hypothetical protein